MVLETVEIVIACVVFLFALLVFVFSVFALKVMKKLITLVKIILINSVTGAVALFLLSLLGVNVPLTAPVLISIAIFGIPGLGTILLLMFFGVKIG